MGTAAHFSSISSATVEVNKFCCQSPAKQPRATLPQSTSTEEGGLDLYLQKAMVFTLIVGTSAEHVLHLEADIQLQLYLNSHITESPLKQGKYTVVLYFKC